MMNDPVDLWIYQQLAAIKPNTTCVWCIDENLCSPLPTQFTASSLLAITNRWDLANSAKDTGLAMQFSDFDFTKIADESVDMLVYRVSKEKAVVHHLLNQAWRCLKIGGELILAGYKNEGIKTYIEKIADLMADGKKIQKHGAVYSTSITKKSPPDLHRLLDDNDYDSLRPIAENLSSDDVEGDLNLVSKPGLFGWNKIDQGSALLIQQLAKKQSWVKPPQTALDLGCGYGYLSLAASRLPNCTTVTHWTLTDNNAAALMAAQLNITNNQINGQIIASDAGRQITTKADLILCNPPFHQGFNVEGDLTDKFLHNAKKLLTAQGVAMFVVNQFIPLERKAVGLFSQIKLLSKNGKFKVVELSN